MRAEAGNEAMWEAVLKFVFGTDTHWSMPGQLEEADRIIDEAERKVATLRATLSSNQTDRDPVASMVDGLFDDAH